ncbi:MAG: hypothetical protein GY795_09935 [Desulfobacterales bacterium]|nr:hypothetical protein [Desulfobacterales bacterium]
MALLNFKEKKFIEALTLLRKGFIKNIYIAKSLLGINPTASKEEYNQVFDENSMCKPETANDYIELNFEMWKSIDGAIPFLRSVYNNSIVKSETEAFFRKLTELFNAEPHSLKRENYIKQVKQMENGIDDSSSKKIFKTIESAFH